MDGKQEAVDKVVNTVLEKVELADRRLAPRRRPPPPDSI